MYVMPFLIKPTMKKLKDSRILKLESLLKIKSKCETQIRNIVGFKFVR